MLKQILKNKSLQQISQYSVTTNKHSHAIAGSKARGTQRAFLYGIGLKEQDMAKPFIGVAACYLEGNPCNVHLNDFADICKKSIQKEGINGLKYNTISISDALSMGLPGMQYSLISREVIADSIETVTQCLHYDGNVLIPSCDKNMPGVLIAAARLNRPSVVVYGGSQKGGKYKGQSVDIGRSSQVYGEYLAGKITDEEREGMLKCAVSTCGSCAGMYTANSMAVSLEALGMSLPNSSSLPAVDQLKIEECEKIGAVVRNMLEKDILPLDIMTRKGFENAIATGIAFGGSTNIVLHYLAIAKAAGIPFTLEDIQQISNKTPYLANIAPSGKYYQFDLHEMGGTAVVIKHLIKNGFLHGDALTVTGKTLAENVESFPDLETIKQDVIYPVSNPIKKDGNIKVLKGSLCPEGSVAKISGKEGTYFKGEARVYNDEREFLEAFAKGDIVAGNVGIIRYEGPSNGMPEMLTVTGAIMGAGLSKDVPLITDGRFSGASHGFIVGHVTPEAYKGGPIGLVENGDIVEIDVDKREINLQISEEQWKTRRENFKPIPLKCKKGVLWKFGKNCSSASQGCNTEAD